MSPIAKKWQITQVNSFKYDDDHEVDLSHDQDKVNWFVTIKGDFYTEFTFDREKDALDQYELIRKASNMFTDSLLVGTSNYGKGGK